MHAGLRAAWWALVIAGALVFAVWLGHGLAERGYSCVVVAKVLVCHRAY